MAASGAERISVPDAPVYRGPVNNGSRAADGTSWFARSFTNAGESEPKDYPSGTYRCESASQVACPVSLAKEVFAITSVTNREGE